MEQALAAPEQSCSVGENVEIVMYKVYKNTNIKYKEYKTYKV